MGKNKRKNRRVPKYAIEEHATLKVPIIEEHASFDSYSPTWLFSIFDASSEKWGMSVFQNKVAIILDKFKSFETMTWNEIKKQKHDNNKGSNHFIAIDKLSKQAQDRLIEINMDDVPNVFSLRLSNKFRLLGIMKGSSFQLLWVDPEHEVCPSSKKHT